MTTTDTTAQQLQMRLALASTPESATVVRSVLSAVSDEIGLDAESAGDVRTAVSEACNNVILHAYPDGAGPMTVTTWWDGRTLAIDVEDEGLGLAHVTVSEDRMGLGLALISALADRAEFRASKNSRGTCVRMRFDIGARTPKGADGQEQPPVSRTTSDEREARPIEAPDDVVDGDIIVWLSPPHWLQPIAPRLLRAVGAVYRFTVPGVADITTAADALSAWARRHARGRFIGLAITATPRRLEISVGPLFGDTSVDPLPGDGDSPMSADGPSASDLGDGWAGLLRASDEAALESRAGGDLLRMRVSDRHR